MFNWLIKLAKATAAIVICALTIIPVIFVLENLLGWTHKVADPIAMVLALIVFVFGWLLPFEVGVKYRLKLR